MGLPLSAWLRMVHQVYTSALKKVKRGADVEVAHIISTHILLAED